MTANEARQLVREERRRQEVLEKEKWLAREKIFNALKAEIRENVMPGVMKIIHEKIRAAAVAGFTSAGDKFKCGEDQRGALIQKYASESLMEDGFHVNRSYYDPAEGDQPNSGPTLYFLNVSWEPSIEFTDHQ